MTESIKAIACQVCSWRIELPEDLDTVMQAVTVLHVALRHPATFEIAVERSAAEALAHYRTKYGEEFVLTAVRLEKEAECISRQS